MTPACSRASPQHLDKVPYENQHPAQPLTPVIQNHVRSIHQLGGTKREQARVAGAGAHKVHRTWAACTAHHTPSGAQNAKVSQYVCKGQGCTVRHTCLRLPALC